MNRASKAANQPHLQQQAVSLLSQQVWCWGRDILRPQGNWLTEIGFERSAPPADRSGCPSIYKLELGPGRQILLRGFGVFYCDARLGSVFLHRYQFTPRYSPTPTLASMPWLPDDLPEMKQPTQAEHAECKNLTVDLVDWIARYELDIAQTLGIPYRDASLEQWHSPDRQVIPASRFAHAWRELTEQLDHDFDTLLPQTRGLNTTSSHRRTAKHLRIRRPGKRTRRLGATHPYRSDHAL